MNQTHFRLQKFCILSYMSILSFMNQVIQIHEPSDSNLWTEKLNFMNLHTIEPYSFLLHDLHIFFYMIYQRSRVFMENRTCQLDLTYGGQWTYKCNTMHFRTQQNEPYSTKWTFHSFHKFFQNTPQFLVRYLLTKDLP